MLRFAFYFFIVLVVCAIGIFAFSRMDERSAEALVITPSSTTENAQFIENPHLNSSQKIFEEEDEEFDEEKIQLLIFQPTIKKWQKGEKIKNVLTEVSDETVREMWEISKADLTEEQRQWFWDYRYTPQTLDANGDGVNELSMMNFCAPVGNCQFWLFKKDGKSYETLLKTEAGVVQTFKLRKTKAHGYFDLETRVHGDAWSGGIEVYKFNGKEYKVSECFSYNYSYLKDGVMHELKEPIIKSIKCSEE